MRRLGDVAFAVLLASAAKLPAQGPAGYAAARDPLLADSALAAAVQLVTAGQGDSGRAVVRARMAGLSPTDSLYPGVLYAAGVVAADADSALTYFRRVSIEYSQSAWAAPALVRLAQFAYATGDYAGAATSAKRVLSDYPGSPVRGAAAYWTGRAELELHDLTAACGHLQTAEAQAGQDVETANRARFYLQRCAAVATTPPESTARAPAAPTAGFAGFTVQVAAVQSAAAADEVMRRLTGQGYQPRVVRDTDGLFKVRVGHYRTREEAQRLVAELKRKLGGSPFVVEESH